MAQDNTSSPFNVSDAEHECKGGSNSDGLQDIDTYDWDYGAFGQRQVKRRRLDEPVQDLGHSTYDGLPNQTLSSISYLSYAATQDVSQDQRSISQQSGALDSIWSYQDSPRGTSQSNYSTQQTPGYWSQVLRTDAADPNALQHDLNGLNHSPKWYDAADLPPVTIPDVPVSWDQPLPDEFPQQSFDDISQGHQDVPQGAMQSTEEPLAQELCCGALRSVNCQLLGDPDDERLLESGTDQVLLSVARFEHAIVLQNTEPDKNVASLNTKASKGLVSLMTNSPLAVRLEGRISHKVWVKKIGEWSKSAPSTWKIDCDIIVYSRNPEAVGPLLAKYGLYLQHVSRQELKDGVEFSNPQELHLDFDVEADKMDVDQVADVVNNVPQFTMDDADSVMIPSTILTQLQKWQLSGVAFMLSKEARKLSDNLSLWQIKQRTGGIKHYANIFDQSDRSTEPKDPPSGILADEMGLGKTLTTLTTIVKTLSEALAFQTTHTDHSSKSPVPRMATLVVLPNVLVLDGWLNEIKKRLFPDTLKVHKYHGYMKEIDHGRLADKHVVLTTYATVEHDARPKGHKFFAGVRWYRIVLDEAHLIRSDATKQFEAICSLEAEHRWCLTATPIQNKIEDLGALVQFLRIPAVSEPSVFRKKIADPCKRDSNSYLYQKLVSNLILRRERDLLQLPEPAEEIRFVELSKEERGIYNKYNKICSEQMEQANRRKLTMAARKHRLNSYLRLRMVCNHGTVGSQAFLEEFDEARQSSVLSAAEADHATKACLACKEELNRDSGIQDPGGTDVDVTIQKTYCHFCRADMCDAHYLQYGQSQYLEDAPSKCHDCNRPIKKDIGVSISRPSLDIPKHVDIAKERCSKLQEVSRDIKQCSTSIKSIVFSTWTTSLNLLCRVLKDNGVKHCFVHGGLSMAERARLLHKFRTDQSCSALLMTFGTGGVGLNLVNASRIHILEPHWNPAVEVQAIGRAVRLGQTSRVTVIRYIVRGTVEEKVKRKQQTKENLQRDFRNNTQISTAEDEMDNMVQCRNDEQIVACEPMIDMA